MAGNPLCNNLNHKLPNALNNIGLESLCKQQCSVDCPDYYLGGDYCNDGDLSYQHLRDGEWPEAACEWRL